MNKKGFVTSALLYGVLSLFLIFILGTVAVIGNRKLTNDKIKRSALDDTQMLTTDESCFTTIPNEGTINSAESDSLTITDYNTSCSKTVFIPEKISGSLVSQIGKSAFKNKGIINITIKSNIKTIYYDAFEGNDNVLFILKSDKPATGVPEGGSPIEGTIWGATNSSIRQD